MYVIITLAITFKNRLKKLAILRLPANMLSARENKCKNKGFDCNGISIHLP